MKNSRKYSTKTRMRLLMAACKVFTEKGFRDATIAEICEQAGTNIASVNYHFGDKGNLYKESWHYAFRQSLKSYPPDGGVSEDAQPEDRLRGWIKSLIYRINDHNSCDFYIVHKELANPTGLLKEIMKKEIDPLNEGMCSIIRELLGPHATDRQVQFCQESIMSQCFHLLIARKNQLNNEAIQGPHGIDDIDAFIEHIVKFSLAGIRAVHVETSINNENNGIMH